MELLRFWLTGSALLLAGFFIWAYVPILVPFVVLTCILGLLTYLVVIGTRALERWLQRRRERE